MNEHSVPEPTYQHIVKHVELVSIHQEKTVHVAAVVLPGNVEQGVVLDVQTGVQEEIAGELV